MEENEVKDEGQAPLPPILPSIGNTIFCYPTPRLETGGPLEVRAKWDTISRLFLDYHARHVKESVWEGWTLYRRRRRDGLSHIGKMVLCEYGKYFLKKCFSRWLELREIGRGLKILRKCLSRHFLNKLCVPGLPRFSPPMSSSPKQILLSPGQQQLLCPDEPLGFRREFSRILSPLMAPMLVVLRENEELHVTEVLGKGKLLMSCLAADRREIVRAAVIFDSASYLWPTLPPRMEGSRTFPHSNVFGGGYSFTVVPTQDSYSMGAGSYLRTRASSESEDNSLRVNFSIIYRFQASECLSPIQSSPATMRESFSAFKTNVKSSAIPRNNYRAAAGPWEETAVAGNRRELPHNFRNGTPPFSGSDPPCNLTHDLTNGGGGGGGGGGAIFFSPNAGTLLEGLLVADASPNEHNKCVQSSGKREAALLRDGKKIEERRKGREPEEEVEVEEGIETFEGGGESRAELQQRIERREDEPIPSLGVLERRKGSKMWENSTAQATLSSTLGISLEEKPSRRSGEKDHSENSPPSPSSLPPVVISPTSRLLKSTSNSASRYGLHPSSHQRKKGRKKVLGRHDRPPWNSSSSVVRE